MYLSESELKEVIRFAPLVTIDLCITNKDLILLGKRINPPAQNTYFVPGGRIRKLETIKTALDRIIFEETGRKIKIIDKLKLLGIYEHFYDDNFLGNNKFNTHIVVIAYNISISSLTEIDQCFKNNQHLEYIWCDMREPPDINIHNYTREYFKKFK